MARIDSLRTLLVQELRDIYDAEKRLTKAIPKLAKAATSEDLSGALEEHLTQTEEQVTRLERAFEALGEPAKGKECAGIKGIIEEGDEHVGEDFGDDGLRDATIIGSAQRVEHYEIAAYGTAIAHARLLGQDEVVSLLEETLEEEISADEKLTEIAEQVVNPDAASGEKDEATEESDDREMVGAASGAKSGQATKRGNGGRGAGAGRRNGRSRSSRSR
ncbi:MAG TPA: ferritin-like domain-containing protein [Vicinamibacterales bacterium]|nr:ferritin-like domain-containing protein [Vicinamibacterales bacterium]